MNKAAASECPEPLRQAFLELLTWTFLYIRNKPSDANLCFAHADHMHNVPGLLARFRTEQLAYYWEVERPIFLRNLKAIGEHPSGAFEHYWEVVEREYRRLCQSSTA